MVPGAQKMVECDRAEPVVACAAGVGNVEADVARMGKGDIGIDSPAGTRAVAGGAVFQCGWKTALVAERAARGAVCSSDAIQVRAVAAVAGIEAGGAGLAVEIPGGADGINRGYDAECGGNLKDPGMGRKRGMAYFTPRVAEGCINEISELDIEARVASRSSEAVIGMALLAIRQIGLCCRAVVARLRPTGRVSQRSMTEGAVETARVTRSICGDDRSSQVCPIRVAAGADRGVQPGCIVNGIGVGRRGIRPPGNRRMRRPHWYAVRHMA